jgi:hypothetical protein
MRRTGSQYLTFIAWNALIMIIDDRAFTALWKDDAGALAYTPACASVMNPMSFRRA